MLLQYLVIPILLLGQSITSLALTISTIPALSTIPGPVRDEHLQNPYPIPGTRLLLDFYNQDFGVPVPRGLVVALLDKVRRDIVNHLHQHGDGPIGPGTQRITHMGEVFAYESIRSARKMSYGELLAVARGFSAKCNADGYQNWVATVLFDEPGGHFVETGEAALLRSVGRSND